MLENVLVQETEEVRVLCVIDCGLYRLERLFLSKLDEAKFTLAVNVVKGLAFASCR
jgi:hypothetical protein